MKFFQNSMINFIIIMLLIAKYNSLIKNNSEDHNTSVKVKCRTTKDCNTFYTCESNSCVHKGFFPLT